MGFENSHHSEKNDFLELENKLDRHKRANDQFSILH